ncbi:hypothetical protein BdWA1_000730 [Babesia duncani]|uniref:Rhoptry neck protein 5 n=1 Tax=Babesia duncani TaxID=323732 RepID=A0AAD9UQC0_9APIC|nr:hypothetical protein BdWA1_000730 [Babesia duncani]
MNSCGVLNVFHGAKYGGSHSLKYSNASYSENNEEERNKKWTFSRKGHSNRCMSLTMLISFICYLYTIDMTFALQTSRTINPVKHGNPLYTIPEESTDPSTDSLPSEFHASPPSSPVSLKPPEGLQNIVRPNTNDTNVPESFSSTFMNPENPSQDDISKQDKPRQFTAAELVKGTGKNVTEDGIDVDDLHADENTKLSSLTLNVDQDWLRKENQAKNIEHRLTNFGGYNFNRTSHTMEPVPKAPIKLGGIIQTLVDKESEMRRRSKQRVLIEHDLRMYVTKETADIVAILTNKDIHRLRKQHPLVAERILEVLKALTALNMLSSKERNMAATFNKQWYTRANISEKKRLLDNIKKSIGDPTLYAMKAKEPNKKNEEEIRIYNKLLDYHTDYTCQRIVRGNQFAERIFRQYDENSGLFIAPFYMDVVPALGSAWLNSMFDRYYKQTDTIRPDELAKGMPQLIGRFMLMVEQGTVFLINPEVQASLHTLAVVISRIMNGVSEPKTFLGKKGYYGFMNMCDIKCAKGILVNYRGKNPQDKLIHNKQREILKLVSMYLRDDLFKIDTAVQKTLVQIMYRTTKDPKFRESKKRTRLELKSEILKNKEGHSFVQIPSVFKSFMNRFLSGYRQMGKKVNNKGGSADIKPYNVFKSPNKITASLDDGLISMVELMTDVINSDSNEHGINLYYLALNVWVQVQGYHEAIHGFESQKSKANTQSKTLGALFRFLNMNLPSHLSHLPKLYLPVVSLVMQLLFFLQNNIEGYERNMLKSIMGLFKGLKRLNLRLTAGPKDFQQLFEYLEPHVIYNKSKYSGAMGVMETLVSEFKETFMAKPAIPAPVVQLISTFVGLWVKGKAEVLDLASRDIDRVRKIFLLNYMSNSKGVVDVATRIIQTHCKAMGKHLHFGCIKGKNSTQCKPVMVGINTASLRSKLQLLDATFEDPLDIIRVASDLARRCISQRGQGNVKRQKAAFNIKNIKKFGLKKIVTQKAEFAHAIDRTLLHSEFAHRWHCYHAQKKMVNEMLKSLGKATSEDAAKGMIKGIFAKHQYIEITMASLTNNSGHKLVCPFMEGSPDDIRDAARDRIVKYVTRKMTTFKRLMAGARAIFNTMSNKPNVIPSQPVEEFTENLVGCVLVGTRTFDGMAYHGGFVPMQKIKYPKDAVLKPGDGRLVYDGQHFTSELDALHDSAGVVAITMENKNGTMRRIYHVASGIKYDELEFGLQSSNFIIKAHVLLTANALVEMGHDIGNLVWCGYQEGWVLESALHEILGIVDVPVFNGKYWLLSRELTIGDVVGEKAGTENAKRSVKDIRVVLRDSSGKNMSSKGQKIGDATKFIQGGSSDACFTFDSGYGRLTPGAITDLIRSATFDPSNNALVLDLEATQEELDDSLFITREDDGPQFSFPSE